MKGKLKLWQKVILGMVLGMIVGQYFGDQVAFLKYFGDIFINMIKMVVVPLIFFSILNGVITLDNTSTFTRLGIKAVIAYSCTTIFAVIIGLLFANIFEPGVGVHVPFGNIEISSKTNQQLMNIIVNMIPSNPINAMATGNTVQVVVFAFFTGISLMLIGDKGREVRNFIGSATALVFKMIELVIHLTPYGVFALMSYVVGTYGIGVMFSLGKFTFVVIAALLTQYMVFGLIIIVFTRLSPLPFYRKMITTQALAFATVSSKATLATAMSEMRYKMGVSKQSASFVLPLGASMNMDGVAIYLGICTVFFSQMFGIPLDWHQYLTVILTSTIGSIGAAGFPGGSMVMMGMVLSSVGLPIEGISLIIGVDRLLEMIRTVINITGDCTVTLIVDKLDGSLNTATYYAKVKKEE